MSLLSQPLLPVPAVSPQRASAPKPMVAPEPQAAATRPPDLEPSERPGLRDGHPDVLARFYDVYFSQVYGYVRRMVREEHLAEDLTQDIFLHLQGALSSYDPERELRPWVFTIATNKVRDHWRSRRHASSQREVSAEDDALLAVDPTRGPTGNLEGEELKGVVAQAIAELPEIMQTTLTLRYYEGLSFAEIGVIVERNEVAVRKRYSRAMEELRVRLRPFLEEDQVGFAAEDEAT